MLQTRPQILLGTLIVLCLDLAQRPSVQRLALFRWRKVFHGQRTGGEAHGELAGWRGALERRESGVGEQRETNVPEGLDEVCGGVVGQDRVDVEVSKGFLVLVERDCKVALLECSVRVSDTLRTQRGLL